MMDQANQGNNSDASPAIPEKRKRGRPRKDRSLNRAEGVRVPPGFEVVNGNQPHQVDPTDGANDGVVGVAVTGVVEAVFDAGYLLAVKIGNSNTILRGVIFKPGHYSPVTQENDVAPHVRMISRNEIHLPKQKRNRVRGPYKRSREKNYQHANYLVNGSPPANLVRRLAPQMDNLVTSKGKYASVVAAPSVPPVGARGTLVPVILQPVNLLNGLPPANQVPPTVSQAAHMMALKGKHVQTVAPLAFCPPNGSTPINQMLALTSQALPSQSQTSPQVTPKGVKNENGPFYQGTQEPRQGEETKSMKSTDVLTSGEVTKGIRGSSQSSETQDSVVAPEREIGDMNGTLFIEPLQAVHSNLHNPSASVSKIGENNRTGRMTELLLENITVNQFPQVEHMVRGSRVEFHELKSPETDQKDEDTVQS